MRRQQGGDRRGRVGYGRDRRPAGRLRAPQRAAMRLLHPRDAAKRTGVAGTRRRAKPGGDPGASVGQLLPLHRVSGDCRCGGGRGEDAAGTAGVPPASGGRANCRHACGRKRAGGTPALPGCLMKITPDLPSELTALDRPNSYIRRSVPRPNLARLTQGRGQYVSDVTLPRMAHVAFVRSPYAHAHIAAIDSAAAKAAPGVIAVVTGAELAKVITPWVGVLTHLQGIKSAPQHAT